MERKEYERYYGSEDVHTPGSVCNGWPCITSRPAISLGDMTAHTHSLQAWLRSVGMCVWLQCTSRACPPTTPARQ